MVDCFSLKALTAVDGTLYVSDAKGSCVKDQTSTVKASRGSGTLVLTPYSKAYLFTSEESVVIADAITL